MTSINPVLNCTPTFKGKVTPKEWAEAVKRIAIAQSCSKEEFNERLTTECIKLSYNLFDTLVAKKLADELAKKMAKGAYKPQ